MAFSLDDLVTDAEGGTPFEFVFGGVTFTLPPHADMRAIGTITEGQVLEPLRKMLGAEQYTRFLEVPNAFDERHFAALITAYSEHIGATSANPGG